MLGAACVGVVAYYMDHGGYYHVAPKAELFYLLVAVAFLIGTFCLVTACVVSLSTASIISKTVYVSKIHMHLNLVIMAQVRIVRVRQ